MGLLKRPLFCFDQHIGEWRVNPYWCDGGDEPEPDPEPGPSKRRIFDDTFDVSFE